MSLHPSGRDKDIERARYNDRAAALKSLVSDDDLLLGSLNVRAALRAPYIKYETLIQSNINRKMRVLELGAGTGNHTFSILATGAHTVASDLSEVSLQILIEKYVTFSSQLKTCHADMENLPFENESFDAITSAGSLSYGDSNIVRKEILRVLKPNGVFICVDSLKSNPIYSLNRWVHFFRNERSLSTLRRMPSMRILDDYSKAFQETNIYYFGALSFLAPALATVLGESGAATFLDKADHLLKTKRSAFKFVMCARKRTNTNA